MAEEDQVPVEQPAGLGGLSDAPSLAAPGDFTESTPKPKDPFAPPTRADELSQRFGLNVFAGKQATLSGAGEAAAAKIVSEGGSSVAYPVTGNPFAQFSQEVTPKYLEDKAKDDLEKMQAQEIAYRLSPSWKGVVEGGVALAGQLVGGAQSPENLIAGAMTKGYGALSWFVKHPVFTDIIGQGVTQSLVQAGSDPIIQALRVKADLQREYDPVQTSWAIPLGFGFGVGFASVQHGASSIWRSTVDALEKRMINGVLTPPSLTPELKPRVGPEPPIAPRDTFQPGTATEAVPGAALGAEPAPTVGGMEAPREGFVRLYRAAGPEDTNAGRIAFATKPFANATEYIDLPENIAVQLTHGDRVLVPSASAIGRQPLPQAPEAAAVDPYADLGAVTKVMRQDLADAGYSADDIKKMTPAEAHEALLKSDEADVVSAELARRGPADLSNLVARNENEARVLEIAKELDTLGPDAANYAVGARASVKSGIVTPASVAGHEARLAAFRARAGGPGKKPNEAGVKTLTSILTDRNQKALDEKLPTWPEETQNVIADAADEFADAVRFINDSGFKLDEVNSHTAKDAPQVREAKMYTANLGGAVSRLIGSFFERAKRNNKSPGSGDARIKADTENVRTTIDEGPELPKAPVTEATPAGEQGVIPGAERINAAVQAQRAADQPLRPGVEQREAGGLFGDQSRQLDLADATPKERLPQTFTQWVRSQGGLKDNAELTAIFGRKKVDLLRKNGKSLDEMRELAVEQGWIPDQGRETGGPSTSTVRDVLDRLADEDKGVKHYHPGDLHRVRAPDAQMIRAQDEVDTALREFNLHPDQTTNAKAKAERRGIRDDAIDDVYRGGLEPDTAVERATARLGEHGRAAEGAPRFDDGVEIPFDTGPTPRAGGGAGEAGPGGIREPSGEPPVVGRGPVASAEDVIRDTVSGRSKEFVHSGVTARPGEARTKTPIASAGELGAQTPIESMQQMMRRISDRIRFEVRKGVTQKGAVAQYDFDTHIARLADFGPDGVPHWLHELGHHFENTIGTPLKRLLASSLNTMDAMLGNAMTGAPKASRMREGFGEFLASYVTNRPKLETIDSAFVKRFVDVMSNTSDESRALLKALNDAHTSYEIYRNAPSDVASESMIRSHGDLPSEPRGLLSSHVSEWFTPNQKDPLQRTPFAISFSNFYWNYVNRQHPLSIAVRHLAQQWTELPENKGKFLDLPPHENPVVLAQVLGRGGSQKTIMDLTRGVQSLRTLTPEGPAMFSVMRRVLADAVTGLEPDARKEASIRKSWDVYLSSLWHLELVRQARNGERILDRAPTGMTDADARANIAKYEQLRPDWIYLKEEIYEINRRFNYLEQEAGLITKEEFDFRMQPNNRQYVPFRRDMTGIAESMFPGGQFIGEGKGLENLPIFKRKGSGRDIMSPMEVMQLRLAEINDHAYENMIVTSLRDLARLVGGRHGAAIVNEIPNNVIRTMTADAEDVIYKAALANGWLAEDARDLARSVTRQMGPNTRARLYNSESLKPGGRPIVFGWENGERYALELPDSNFGRQLVEVIDGLGPKGIQSWAQASGLVIDTLQVTSSTLRAGATGTFTFMVKNVVRDSFMQYLMIPETGHSTLALANAVRGGKSMLGFGDEMYRFYMSTEGIRGGAVAQALGGSSRTAEFERQQHMAYATPEGRVSASSAREKQRDRVQAARELEIAGVAKHQQLFFGDVKELMSKMEFSESAGRIGLFRAVYENNIALGRSQQYAMFDAAQKARDFVDYGRFGSKAEMISRLVPFLNANIQGIDKFVRTYSGTPTNPGLFFKALTQQQADTQHAIRTSLIPRAAALGVISATLTYIYEDDPVYQRISEEQRAKNWYIKIPWVQSGIYDMLGGGSVELPEGMEGAWAVVPKPFEVASIFNLAERAVQFVNSGDPDHAFKAINSLRWTLAPPNPLSFPLLTTITGLESNWSQYNQRPIIPDSLKHLAPHLQANENTSAFYKAIANGLFNVTPTSSHKWIKEKIPVVGALLAAPWSPIEAQYMMQGVFGDWPRELGGIAGVMKSLIEGGPEAVEAKDIPVVRAFVRTRMAMGEPMNELYNQIGQNSGSLALAKASFDKLAKTDPAQRDSYFNALPSQERDYIRIHNAKAGPLANVLHPIDRSSALATVVRGLKDGLFSEGGVATLTDPNIRIKMEPAKRNNLVQMINEYAVMEVTNGLILQGANGFKNRPLLDTKPYLNMIDVASPQVGKELRDRLAQAKVMPTETIQTYWPAAQRILRAGPSAADPLRMQKDIMILSNQAASQGYEGGGRKSGRGAVDSEGRPIKKGKVIPQLLPAEE